MENFGFLGGVLLLVLGLSILAFGKKGPDPSSKGKTWEKALSPLRLQYGHEVLKWFAGLFLALAGLFLVLSHP